jgi:hypothetical protein
MAAVEVRDVRINNTMRVNRPVASQSDSFLPVFGSIALVIAGVFRALAVAPGHEIQVEVEALRLRVRGGAPLGEAVVPAGCRPTSEKKPVSAFSSSSGVRPAAGSAVTATVCAPGAAGLRPASEKVISNFRSAVTKNSALSGVN